MSATNVLILSDSHGKIDAIGQVLQRSRPDLILFCGDGLRDLTALTLPCPVYAVRGNCDVFTVPGFEDAGDDLCLTIDGVKLLMTHGHRYGVKGGLGALVSHAVRLEADGVIFGHTHAPLEMTLRPESGYASLDVPLTKPLYVFNPGSLGDFAHSFGTLTVKGGVPLFGHGTLNH